VNINDFKISTSNKLDTGRQTDRYTQREGERVREYLKHNYAIMAGIKSKCKHWK